MAISLVWDHQIVRAYQKGVPSLLLYLAVNIALGAGVGWIIWRANERKFLLWSVGTDE